MPSTLSVKVTTDQTMETNVSEVMTSRPSTILIQDTTEASSERISTEKFIETTKPQQKGYNGNYSIYNLPQLAMS